ncbi:MAG TPA: Xaa-Pro peptidase family protein [Solirubrobacteraceae bacterium]|jgi:Xaa-Pro aminopeptidase|nr:Xaa-Pro peptidase family protein [Solirubrobacteraceae bacterium]
MSTRAARLIAALDGATVDLMLISNLVNVRYLTGFTGSNGLAVIGPQTHVFLTDFRYTEQAEDEVYPEFERITVAQNLITDALNHLPEGSLRVGYESETVTVDGYERMRELFPERAELVAVKGLVENMRVVKDEGEIELITAATKIADQAFEALLADGLAGRTERELALALEHDMRLRGAESPSFDSIVAGGAHGALPHATPRDVKIEQGQLVVIDWGAKYAGYCSDCTRTVAVGEPGPEAREAYELVLGAQQVGLDEVRAGGNGKEIDKAVRDIIYGAGHEGHYGHGLGHGVGLDIHEAPTLSFRAEDTLQAGTVVTVEPGVYLPGRFGIRIEDLVVVTADGVRILTQIPKGLRAVD